MSFDSSVTSSTLKIDISIPQRLLCNCQETRAARGDMGFNYVCKECRFKNIK